MKKQKGEKKKIFGRRIVVSLLIICLFVPFAVWQTNSIEVTEFTYANPKIPADFEGFKIVQLSDVHNKSFGKDQSKLLKLIEEARPDVIVITGDLIDDNTRNLDSIEALFAGTAAIAPVYYVEGNHDRVPEYYKSVRNIAKQHGVIFLENEEVTLTRNQSAIKLAGIADPMHFSSEAEYEDALKKLMGQGDEFTILLSHRPERIELYEKYGADVCFTGHAHGGQIALPFIGPVIAPQQGLFPEYTSGMYQSGDTTMFVNRGLGTVVIPVRLFARPQIVCVTLSART